MTNQIQALALLPKLSEQQLMQVLQTNDGSVPSYAVMAELQARKKRAAGAGGAMPTSSVKDDMLRQDTGLQSIAPAPRGLAEGGTPARLPAVGYDDYAEARRRYLESGGQDAPESPSGWSAIKNWFGNHPLLNGSYDAATRPPAAAPGQPPFSDARMSGGYGPGTQTRTEEQVKAKGKDAGTSGLRSIRASASGKVSPGGPGPSGFNYEDIKLRSIGDAMKDVPMDGSLAEQIAAYKAQAGDVDKRRNDAKYEALIRAGLTMARTPGGLSSSIAAGGLEGLNAYGSGMKDANSQERERMKELAALQQAQSAQGLQRYGIANATRFGEAGIADKNQDNRFNAYKTGVESADRRYAADAGVRAASIRAENSGTSPEKYRIDMAKQLRGAVEKARENVSKNGLLALGASPTASPQARMAYEKAIEDETLRTLSTMTLEYPEIMDLYKQMRGSSGPAPGIIRNGAPPPGAVVRQ